MAQAHQVYASIPDDEDPQMTESATPRKRFRWMAGLAVASAVMLGAHRATTADGQGAAITTLDSTGDGTGGWQGHAIQSKQQQNEEA